MLHFSVCALCLFGFAIFHFLSVSFVFPILLMQLLLYVMKSVDLDFWFVLAAPPLKFFGIQPSSCVFINLTRYWKVFFPNFHPKNTSFWSLKGPFPRKNKEKISSKLWPVYIDRKLTWTFGVGILGKCTFSLRKNSGT